MKINIVELILKNRLLVIIATLLITLILGLQITKLKIEGDILKYLPEDDPTVVLFNRVGDEFGGNSLALIAIETDDVFTKETIEHINLLTEQFKLVDGITNVTSLTDVLDIKKTDEGLEIGKLIDQYKLPQTAEELKQLKKYTLSKDLYNGRIVSKDAKAALIICRIAENMDKAKTAAMLKEIVSKADLPEQVYLSGIPFQLNDITEVIFKDLNLLLPIIIVVILLTLFLSYGTFRGVILPLLSTLISIVWTLGLMSIFDIRLTVISNIIPVILIATGTAYGIHVVSKYDEILNEGNSTHKNLVDAIKEVSTPVLLTGITTMIGFISFIFGSYLTMIREFGFFTAVGILFSLTITLVFIPSVLSYLTKTKKKSGFIEQASFISKIMDRLGSVVLSKDRLIIISTFILVIAALFFIPKIERRVNMVDYFKSGTPIRSAQEFMENKFGGSIPIQIFVKGDLQEPVVLKEMWRMEKYLESIPDVNNPQSVASLIAEMHDVMDDQKTIPESRAKVSNLWFLLEGEKVVEQLSNPDHSEGLIQATLGTIDTKKGRKVTDAIDEYLKNLDTNYVIMDLNEVNSLTKEDKEKILRYNASKSAQLIKWIVSKYKPGLSTDTTRISNVLFQEKLKEINESFSDSNAVNTINTVLKIIPSEIRGNEKLKSEITNAVMDLYQPVVLIPQKIFNTITKPETQNPNIEYSTFSFSHTGLHLIYKHLDDSLLNSQLNSMLIAIVLVFFILAVQFRSLIAGLIGLSPILLTIIVTFGLMGILKIPLDVATVLVGSIALGIGIDYSIHFTNRFKNEFIIAQNNNSLNEDNGKIQLKVLDRTLETTGRSIVINALTVTLGFLILIFAQLVPLQRFGILVAAIMIGSSAGSLIFLPSLILVTKAKFIGNLNKLNNRLNSKHNIND